MSAVIKERLVKYGGVNRVVAGNPRLSCIDHIPLFFIADQPFAKGFYLPEQGLHYFPVQNP